MYHLLLLFIINSSLIVNSQAYRLRNKRATVDELSRADPVNNNNNQILGCKEN